MRRAWPLVLVVFLVTGCGYSLRGNLPAHLRTVAVPVLKNLTTQPAVENFVTRAIVDAFVLNGRLRVVKAEEADSILEGEVVGYELQSISFDANSNVRQYRLLVTLNLRFRDVRRNELLLTLRGDQERADFQVTGDVAQNINTQESALTTAATDIGRAIVSRCVDRF